MAMSGSQATGSEVSGASIFGRGASPCQPSAMPAAPDSFTTVLARPSGLTPMTVACSALSSVDYLAAETTSYRSRCTGRSAARGHSNTPVRRRGTDRSGPASLHATCRRSRPAMGRVAMCIDCFSPWRRSDCAPCRRSHEPHTDSDRRHCGTTRARRRRTRPARPPESIPHTALRLRRTGCSRPDPPAGSAWVP